MNRPLAAAVAVLCVAIGGAVAAVAVTLSTDDRSAPPVTVSRTVPQAAARTSTPPATDARSATHGADDLEAAATPIRVLLEDYYTAVRARRFNRAWALLSTTYKSWKADNGGFALWRKQESRNAERLRFNRLRVTVRSLDSVRDVATIHVSGMRYMEPDGSICRYEGVTWARRSEGTWRYDQGYLQDPARAAEWRSRGNETLGYACDESHY